MKRFMLILTMALLMVLVAGYDQPIVSYTLPGVTDSGGIGDEGDDHPWGGDQSGGGGGTTDGTTQAAWMRRTSTGNLFLDWTYWYLFRNPQTVYRFVGDRGLQSRNVGNTTPTGPQQPQTATGRH